MNMRSAARLRDDCKETATQGHILNRSIAVGSDAPEDEAHPRGGRSNETAEGGKEEDEEFLDEEELL